MKRIESKPNTDLEKKRKREGAFGESPTTSRIIAHATVVGARGAGNDSVKERILAIVAGKTGYARDMLDLDLDLKQDLGISEADWDAIFEVIVAEFDIPPINKFQPLNFQTLARVIKFVESIQTELGGGKAISGSSRQTEPQALRSQGAVTQRGVRRSPIKDKLHSRVDAQSMEYAQVLAHAVDTFGSRSNANSWLNKPNRVFHNQSPLQILTQDPAAVEEELVRIDHGMFI